jgi:hypothetical protein
MSPFALLFCSQAAAGANYYTCQPPWIYTLLTVDQTAPIME